jgi:hypothetical protein
MVRLSLWMVRPLLRESQFDLTLAASIDGLILRLGRPRVHIERSIELQRLSRCVSREAAMQSTSRYIQGHWFELGIIAYIVAMSGLMGWALLKLIK